MCVQVFGAMELQSCHWLALVLMPMVVVAMASGEIQQDSAPATAVDSAPAAKSATAQGSAAATKPEGYYGDRPERYYADKPEGYYGDSNHKVSSHCHRGVASVWAL